MLVGFDPMTLYHERDFYYFFKNWAYWDSNPLHSSGGIFIILNFLELWLVDSPTFNLRPVLTSPLLIRIDFLSDSNAP